MCAEVVLDVRNVSRTFNKGNFVAVDKVSFSIHKGEIHALIGPNGAGKTTIVKMVATILDPSSGEIYVDGYNAQKHVSKARGKLGLVLGGDLGFYPRATAEQNLRFFADIAGLAPREIAAEVDRVLEIVELCGQKKDRVNTFSRGMIQRMHIARALLGNPALLILDEPTTGLDPDIALTIRNVIDTLRNEEKAILLTSHTMSEIEGLANQISVIGGGRIHLTGMLTDVLKYADVSVVTTLSVRAEELNILLPLNKIASMRELRKTSRGGYWDIKIIWSGEMQMHEANKIIKQLFNREGLEPPVDLFTRPVTLEDAYLALASELRR